MILQRKLERKNEFKCRTIDGKMTTDTELRDEALTLSKEDISSLSRDNIKIYLRVLGVTYDNKDNTLKLKKLLESAIEKVKGFIASDNDVMETPEHPNGVGATATPTGVNDLLVVIVQMLQQQMQQQDERFRQEQERFRQEQDHRDQQLAAAFGRIGLPVNHSGNADASEDHHRQDVAVKINIQAPGLLEDGITLKTFKKWEVCWKNYAQVTKLLEKT